MLRFASKPDKVFTKIVERSLEEAIGRLKEDIEEDFINFVDLYFEDEIVRSFGGGIGAVRLLKETLEKILQAHKEKDVVYMPTDLHFKLLDRVLQVFCDCYGDLIGEMGEKDLKVYQLKYKGKPIEQLDCGDLIDFFFWDTDYDFDPVVALELQKNKTFSQNMDTSSVAINASIGIAPDTEDLTLTKWDDGDPWEGENGESDLSWLYLGEEA
jgi:hypothetical protein